MFLVVLLRVPGRVSDLPGLPVLFYGLRVSPQRKKPPCSHVPMVLVITEFGCMCFKAFRSVAVFGGAQGDSTGRADVNL